MTQPMKAQNARIKIDVDRIVGEVDSLIYGNFLEHLGRAVYSGAYDPDSPLADEDGFRKDVIQAAKDLNVTQLRYPGGNFVSNYHWQDGVGSDRVPRMELAWGRLESNEFGTNEFMQFTNKIGAKPYFAVNMGTGTMTEAQRWVEYTNVEEGPYYAELRKKHGYEEPWNIKYWSLGNEMDGFWQIGHLNAEDYAKKARETAKVMQLTDPAISLIAAGASNFRPDANPMHWNRVVLEELKNVVDYLALHIYVGNPDNNYYNFLSTPLVLEERTELVEGLIREIMSRADRGDRPSIKIAWDEWNVWYRARAGESMSGERALEERYNLEDALVVAGFLNAFVRNADIVKMANMAQLVNVIAPMYTNENDMFKQTIYYPLQLFSEHTYGTALDVYVDSETYDTERFFVGLGESQTQQSDVPYLDVSASYKDNGEVIINVVNRHKDKAITTDIISQKGKFTGGFKVYEVNGPDVKAQNNFEETNVETEEKSSIQADGSKVTYSFPAHSYTLIKGKITTD
ncbi:alpha-N-arabinofuranosidase [Aliifodinibius salipaludis]|uniref:non-reducing end alpha-L-arabinofuranosidase n=2 Tax=Fodinibius salipaludis TaxID=2032627 RepID=A0A2A2GGF8_9BACT|nr:alpha-N-arabinofuranosidase [Aliifodinibius salipaludis]